VGYVIEVLLIERFIQPHLCHEMGMALCGDPAFPGHNGHRIAGDHMDECKSQQRYADKRWDN
jgi:hypothetical protein